jgi:putative tricarboxylic transport membrane protein
MMELLGGFAAILTNPMNFFIVFLGVLVGIIFGALPGLTSVAALSMFLPITFGMDLGIGISMLCGIYIGATSGGLVPSILLNIPGTPASIATCFDGRPMALNGEAGKALGVGIFASFVGTLVGVLVLIFISPPLASVTIRFGPWENFAVTVFAITLIIGLVGKSLTKGLLSALFGMMIATIGLAPIDGARRYTFGMIELTSGLTLVPVLVGLYAMSEVISISGGGNKGKDTSMITNYKIKGLGFKFAELKDQIGVFIRANLVGLGIGVLPGIGPSTSNIVAYTVNKSASKHPEKYGTGIIDGVISSETSNSACCGGCMVPLLTLGIPGDGSTALLLAGFMLHGVTPGPLLFQTQGPAVYMIFASLILSAFILLGTMYWGLKGFIQILRAPAHILMPLVVVLCVIGAYATSFRAFDAWALLIFGIIGLGLQKFQIPIPPLILGFILGEPLETNLRRGLQYSHGNIADILNHPIALMFFGLIILFFAISFIQKRRRAKRA